MNKLFLVFASILLVFTTQNLVGGQGATSIDSIAVADTITVIGDLAAQEEALIQEELTSTANILDMNRSDGFSLMTILRGLLGMLSLVVIAFIFSANRKAINWRVIGMGLAMQLLLAMGVLYVPWIQYFFEAVGQLFVLVLDFTKAGTEFLFSSFITNNIETALQNFVIQILPTIIFFSALTSLLFYLGIIQRVVKALAWVMTRLLNLSGAESLSVAGNIFLGQTESPLMIKAYLPKMNKSEILLVMMGGMATLAGGGVLAVYISFLGGDDPVQRLLFAKHLLTASVMAAPGAIVISKILMPQTEDIDKTMHISKDQIGSNVLDAVSNGTTEALNWQQMWPLCFWFLSPLLPCSIISRYGLEKFST